MKKWGVLFLVAALVFMVFVSSCKTAVVCNEPYIRHAEGCCLDRDGSNVCDADEDLLEAGLVEPEKIATTTTIEPQPLQPPQPRVVVENARSNYLGKKDAKIAVEVYGDVADLYTTQFYEQVIQKTEIDYVDTGKVVVWFFHAPGISSLSRNAAEASECGGEQGKFFAYYVLVLKNPAHLDVEYLEDYARRLFLDKEQFNRCLSSGKYALRVQEDYELAKKAGFEDRIPVIVINGVQYPRGGLISLYDFRKLLDEELERIG